jgi:hypothetical protein
MLWIYASAVVATMMDFMTQKTEDTALVKHVSRLVSRYRPSKPVEVE